MIEYALLGPIQAVLAVQVFDLQVFALRHVRVVETISAVSAGMHTGFVLKGRLSLHEGILAVKTRAEKLTKFMYTRG